MELLKNLNEKQVEAVINLQNPLLILAGAGSGKTRVITYKISYLIENGFKPYNILALTFTNKAANEMKERAINLSPAAENVWISTFHSLCVRILRREIERLGYKNNFTILDSKDSMALIKSCLKELNFDEKVFLPKNILAQISFNKNKMITPEKFLIETESDFRANKVAQVYKLYQAKLKVENLLDFDDLISLTAQILKNFPDVLDYYREKFKYILVDEYQDTNAAQYLLINLLVGTSKNICVVGDDDQSIYSWRGADIQNILAFENDFPDVKIIKLEQNYRSTQIILDAANSVIKNNLSRKSKNLWTQSQSGSKIFFYQADTYTDEANFLASTILNNLDEFSYKDCAVLYRNNFLSRVIEDEFVKKNIPYKLIGATRFYDHMEIKDLLAYLKFVNNPDDDTSFLRIVNTPKRGIGAKTIEKITTAAAQEKVSCWQILNSISCPNNLTEFVRMIKEFIDYSSSHSIYDLLQKVLTDTDYNQYLQKCESYFSRIENIEEFFAKITEFDDSGSLSDFLQQISLLSEIDNYNENEDAVNLMTLHGAKGLEFPCVFIFGADDEIFPGYLKSGLDLEEERRLFYVGITRAQKKLFISSSNYRLRNGEMLRSTPSQFIDEIPSKLLEREKIISVHKPYKPIYRPRVYEKIISEPKNFQLNYAVGDRVKHFKFGVCTVEDIASVNADYQVTVKLSDGSKKILLAKFTNLAPVE